jgi:hypothetical protein
MSYQHPDDLVLIPELLALAPAVGKPSSVFRTARWVASDATLRAVRKTMRRSQRRRSSQRPCGPAARWLTRC